MASCLCIFGYQWQGLSSTSRRLQERDYLPVSLVNDESDIVAGNSPHAVSVVVSTENGFIHNERFTLCSKQFQAVLVKKDHEQLSLHGLLAQAHHKAKMAVRHTQEEVIDQPGLNLSGKNIQISVHFRRKSS